MRTGQFHGTTNLIWCIGHENGGFTLKCRFFHNANDYLPSNNFLVGGWPTPLKNMSSSVGMSTFPIYGNIKNVPKYEFVSWDDYSQLNGNIKSQVPKHQPDLICNLFQTKPCPISTITFLCRCQSTVSIGLEIPNIITVVYWHYNAGSAK